MSAIADHGLDLTVRSPMTAASQTLDLAPRHGVAREWVLVAGDFHRSGGMDRANAEFASYLSAQGATVHLVSFRVDPDLAARPNVHVHQATRVAGAHSLTRHRLDRLGRAVAAAVIQRSPGARVLVNGVNCDWPDLNWVHFVHQQWRDPLADVPLWFKLKHRWETGAKSRRELRLLGGARMLIANSERTRADLIRDVGVAPDRVRTVYLGCGPEWQPVTPALRAAARAWLGTPADRPLIAFVGAFGHDSRKGFDTLWSAWRSLCARPQWDADLIVAGGGRALPRWRTEIARAGLGSRVRLLGFTDRVRDLLAAADLLVSPVRYESYGLNVQEALASGVPAIVSRSAGVAERYPMELEDLLLPDPTDADDLAVRLLRWRDGIDQCRRRIAPLGASLRAWTWPDMAAQICALAENTAITPAAAAASSAIAGGSQ